jgi:predicted ThiF/HesA family dinucleotide-utilizing enzyme
MADEEHQEVIINDDPEQLHIARAILDNIKAQIQQGQFAPALKLMASTTHFENLKSLKSDVVQTYAALFLHTPLNATLLDDAAQKTAVAINAAKVMGLLGEKKQTENALGWYSFLVKQPGVSCRVLANRK